MNTGFILAGGQSKRMGREKVWLRLGRERMIDLVIDFLRPQVDRLVIIGNEKNSKQLSKLPVDGVIKDLIPGVGPLMGIYTGLMKTETEMNIFITCDMPWVESDMIQSLIQACSRDFWAVGSLDSMDKIQPFPLVCHKKAGELVGNLLDENETSVQSIFLSKKTKLVENNGFSWGGTTMNINTPKDYMEACDYAQKNK